MYSLGIDLGGTNIVASVVDDQFNIISTAKTKTNAPRPANAIFDDVEKVCREAVREAKLTMSDLVAVGMGSPGTCNADGVIEFANNLAFNNVPAREMLRERLGVDNVFVENDANCVLLAERWQGHGIITRACQALIHHAFEEMGMEKVEISAAQENDASRAVCERLGMVQEGVIRRAERLADRVVDHVNYGLLREDWLRQREH